MSFESLLLNVEKHIELNDDEVGYFISLLRQKRVKKNQIIIRQGRSCKTINFVHSGTLRAFFINKEGKESTIMFAINDWWITDMYCFLNQKPAMVNIETLENSVLFQLEYFQLEKLYKKVPKFERFFRILMQNAYTREQLRILQNLSLTAEERYDSFVEKYPLIVQRITQKQMASYIGITPEFLSMIRKRKVVS